MRYVGQLKKWLASFPDDSTLTMTCSNRGDDALISVITLKGEYHDSEEISGWHGSRTPGGVGYDYSPQRVMEQPSSNDGKDA